MINKKTCDDSLGYTTILDPKFHSMEDALYDYLEIKMHHLITREIKKIEIRPHYERESSIISLKEKDGKLFNWKRPTALQKDDKLIIKCFPGEDYVRHYAALISSYYAINNYDIPSISVYYPTDIDTKQYLSKTNIDKIKDFDHVTIGTVEKFENLRDTDWQDKSEDFIWAKKEIYGKSTAVVGCAFSIWGDIGGEVVRRLIENGNKRVIYVGKLGGMNQNQIPNECLANGDFSFVKGHLVKWKNPFDFINDEKIIRGAHYSSYSPVAEHKGWLDQNSDYNFVDPEIGPMAKAANEAAGDFGYLHIISNNLTGVFDQNLSNERKSDIQNRRDLLLKNIEVIILERIKLDTPKKTFNFNT